MPSAPTSTKRRVDHTPPGVQVDGLRKAFPGVLALDDVSLTVRAGTVHALLGENGAGKSTLVRALAGQVMPDAGIIRLAGVETALRNVRDARVHGIALLPQDVALVPNISVGRNVLLGTESMATRRSQLTSAERRVVADRLAAVGADLDPSAPIASLSVSEQRLVQIARVIGSHAQVLILDEPTAVLSDSDAAGFLHRLDILRDRGTTIVYITHRLSEVVDHCDFATVLRNGRVAGQLDAKATDRRQIIELMLGRRQIGHDRRARVSGGRVALQVRGLSSGSVREAALEVAAGEVLGVAGVQGSGIQDLLDGIAGVNGRGHVEVEGQVVGAGNHAAVPGRHRLRAGRPAYPRRGPRDVDGRQPRLTGQFQLQALRLPDPHVGA